MGMSVMWITHDLGIVAEMVHKINVMYAGFIIEEGLVDDIYDETAHPYTKGLLGSLPSIDEAERERRSRRAAWWRKGRARLFALPDPLRQRVREIWRTCPYPADPASFADFLHQIAVGKLDPYRPPWVFHQERAARITRNPATFADAFRQIGRRKAGGGQNPTEADELLFCGNLGSGILFLASQVRPIDPGESLHILNGHRLGGAYVGKASHWVEIEVRGACSDADLALIERLAQAGDTRPVVVRRMVASAAITGKAQS